MRSLRRYRGDLRWNYILFFSVERIKKSPLSPLYPRLLDHFTLNIRSLCLHFLFPPGLDSLDTVRRWCPFRSSRSVGLIYGGRDTKSKGHLLSWWNSFCLDELLLPFPVLTIVTERVSISSLVSSSFGRSRSGPEDLKTVYLPNFERKLNPLKEIINGSV